MAHIISVATPKGEPTIHREATPEEEAEIAQRELEASSVEHGMYIKGVTVSICDEYCKKRDAVISTEDLAILSGKVALHVAAGDLVSAEYNQRKDIIDRVFALMEARDSKIAQVKSMNTEQLKSYDATTGWPE